MKEPSQLALEQFAEAQRKQAAEKGAKATPVSLANVSPQKLPSTVPKVNSKWDGVPDKLKAVETAEKKRTSTSTISTSRMSSAGNNSIFSVATNENQGPPPSRASTASPVSNFKIGTNDDRRDSGPSVSEQEKANLRSTPSTSNLPQISYFFPDNPNPSGALPQNLPPEPPLPLLSMASTATTASMVSTMTTTALAQSLAPSLSTSQTSTSTKPPHSPITSNTSTSSRGDIIKRISLQGFLAGEAQEIQLPDEDEDDVIENSHDFLFELQKTTTDHSMLNSPSAVEGPSPQPPPKNFSRPLSRQLHQPRPGFSRIFSMPRPGVSALPTLYEASINSSVRTEDNASVLTEETVANLTDMSQDQRVDSDSDSESIASSVAPSTAPSMASVTPSEMSASWYRSPRERLGLGGRIRKSETAPWDADIPGKRKKKPLSMFGKGIA